MTQPGGEVRRKVEGPGRVRVGAEGVERGGVGSPLRAKGKNSLTERMNRANLSVTGAPVPHSFVADAIFLSVKREGYKGGGQDVRRRASCVI